MPSGSGRALAARLRERIEREGPIPFAEFMRVALTDPTDGYYTSLQPRPTRDGDYLTAPELHPIFGHCLALQIVEAWDRLGRPMPFTITEYGSGAGTLALAVLDQIRRSSPSLLRALRYEPVELNRYRLAEMRARFEAAGLTGLLGEQDGVPRDRAVIANEYLDALPVHRLVLRENGLRERYVGWSDGCFVELEGPPSSPEVAEAFARLGDVEPGVVVEVRPAVRRWLHSVARILRRGLVVIVDYGGSQAELYGRHHPEGTVVGYRRHGIVPNPLDAPGEQDLTAHVDFSDLATAARSEGLEVLGTVSQAEFLMGCGLEELLRREQASATTIQDLAALRSAVRRLLDPRALGGFRVVLLGRGVPTETPLRGCSFRLPQASGQAGASQTGAA